jgi:membrane-bound lytic murein transglycosylase F
MTRHVFSYAIGLILLLLVLPSGPRRTLPEKAFLSALPSPAGTYPAVPEALGRYEPLLRQYAAGIGWDWRLLAAIVYHESRFNSTAQSEKGATGLMQILSPRYSVDTLLIPAVNLSIGTAYLQKLENMFDAASPSDSLQFALAAYNLGDGKVKRMVAQADSAGMDPTRWEEVSRLLPRGHHTVSYVDKVMETFRQYSWQLPR